MDGMSVFANNRIWLTSGDGAADVVGVYLVFLYHFSDQAEQCHCQYTERHRNVTEMFV